MTHPEKYNIVVGEHRLVGWGNYATLRDSIPQRVFAFMVRATTPVVVEYHGDLFHDASLLSRWLDDSFDGGDKDEVSASFDYLVRYHGTNFGPTARLMFESWAYDEALYRFTIYAIDGTWWLRVELIDARPDRPEPAAHSAETLGLHPVDGA